jgi:Tol biopolymer transport system component
MVGETVQNYRIVETLGQGGMGTVYKALDVRLNRFLALKFLVPERITAERKRRFFQEAKAASALNHPSIVHIYDIGQWEGADFIAMEYVEGSTVQHMLRDGPMPIDDALRYAIQVADAMSVAHAANIIHRDLKPANVMVTARGLVKILDFGVAKLNDPVPARPSQAKSVTEPDSAETTQTFADVNQTLEGMVVGSPAYMSPEQATGKPVDARSDIFEFGLLLHEMLTGQPAFSGATKLEVLSAILRTEPAKPSSINPAVTPELEWVIAHCLRKDREKRFQGMTEVKIALDDLRTETSVSSFRPPALSASQVTVSAVAPAVVPGNRRTWILALGLAVVLGVAAVLTALLLRTSKPAVLLAVNSTPPEVTRITTEGGLCVDPAISPDGKLLVYASDRNGTGNFDLWVRQIGGGDAMRLTRDPADNVEPNFSPDGTKIVFRSTREGGGLYIIPALGGEERKIADGGRQPRFSPDGTKIAYWVGPADPLPLREGIAHAFILDLATSTSRRVRSDFAASARPVWSPDGTHIVFVGLKDAKNKDSFDWWITPLDNSPAVMCRVIGDFFTLDPFAWRGDRVYYTKNDQGRITIGEVRLDAKKFTPAGAPRALTAGTTNEYSPSASKDGKLVFSSIEANSDLFSLPLDANRGKVRGTPERLTKDVAEDSVRSISLDGKKIAFASSRTGANQIWVKDLVSGVERQLTTGSEKTSALISPDGQFVTWRNSSFNDAHIFVTPFNGGLPTEVCADCGVPTAWSPDGRFLVYQPNLSQHLFVGLLEVATGKKIEYLKSPDRQFAQGAISADGKWMVFTVRRAIRDFTIYAAPFSPDRPPPEAEWVEIVRSPETDPNARWSPDGNLLYFSSERDGYNCVWAQRVDHATKHPLGELFAVQHFHVPSQVLVAPAFWYPIALGPDRVVVSLNERSGGIWMLNLQN